MALLCVNRNRALRGPHEPHGVSVSAASRCNGITVCLPLSWRVGQCCLERKCAASGIRCPVLVLLLLLLRMVAIRLNKLRLWVLCD